MENDWKCEYLNIYIYIYISGISTIVGLMLVRQPAASSGQRGSMAGWLHKACLLPSSLGPMFMLSLAPNTCGKDVAYKERSMVNS